MNKQIFIFNSSYLFKSIICTVWAIYSYGSLLLIDCNLEPSHWFIIKVDLIVETNENKFD